MRVMIDDTTVKTKSGTSAKGKAYSIHQQTAYFDFGKRYPTEGKVRLAEADKPWPPGEYTVDYDKSIFVNIFGSPQLSDELVLIPLGQPVPSAKPSIKAP